MTLKVYLLDSKNYRYEQERKLGLFFSYVCNGKKIKELFASTLDKIPISVSCVSSMITVSNDKFALLLAAHADKDTIGTEEARLQNHVLLAETH